jgi:hypothetical protein
MKRVGLVFLCCAAIGLAACESRTPTGPSGPSGNGQSGAVSNPGDTDSPNGGLEGSNLLTAKLTANPSKISAGQSTTLTWTTTNADSVYLDGVSVAKNGSKSVSPRSSKIYALLAIRGSQRTTTSAIVTVSSSSDESDDDDEHDGEDDDDDDDSASTALSAKLTANPTTIQAGQSSTLSWTSSNATSVYLDGAVVAKSGSKTVSPSSTKTYNLLAVSGTNQVTSSATVTVSATAPPPVAQPTASLTANPTSINAGGSTTLTWTTSNATSVTMNGVSVAVNGSKSYSPSVTTTYTLVASNSAGSATATATVTVNATTPPPAPPMPKALINANPLSIQSGQSSTLSWSTSDATTVTLDGAPVNANGSRVVTPTATTTYKLVATNSTGSATSSVTVTVTAAPAGLTWVNDMKPIFDANCVVCHGGTYPTAGLNLQTYSGTMSVVTPYDPNSKLIEMTKTGGPMHGYLQPDPAGKADKIYQWIVTYGAPQQ